MDITSYLLGVSHGKKSGSAKGDTVGTWLFNEEITIPEKLAGRDFSINASISTYIYTEDFDGYGACSVHTLHIYEDAGSLWIYGDDAGIDDWYVTDEGWNNSEHCRVITIHEEPPAEIAEWIRANATKLS